jgi:hypothetical protein
MGDEHGSKVLAPAIPARNPQRRQVLSGRGRPPRADEGQPPTVGRPPAVGSAGFAGATADGSGASFGSYSLTGENVKVGHCPALAA